MLRVKCSEFRFDCNRCSLAILCCIAASSFDHASIDYSLPRYGNPLYLPDQQVGLNTLAVPPRLGRMRMLMTLDVPYVSLSIVFQIFHSHVNASRLPGSAVVSQCLQRSNWFDASKWGTTLQLELWSAGRSGP